MWFKTVVLAGRTKLRVSKFCTTKACQVEVGSKPNKQLSSIRQYAHMQYSVQKLHRFWSSHSHRHIASASYFLSSVIQINTDNVKIIIGIKV